MWMMWVVVVVMCGMGSEHGVDEARIYTKNGRIEQYKDEGI